jgi:hypothetical protein
LASAPCFAAAWALRRRRRHQYARARARTPPTDTTAATTPQRLRATRRRSASYAPQTYDERISEAPVTRREHAARALPTATADELLRRMAPAGADDDSSVDDAIAGLGL